MLELLHYNIPALNDAIELFVDGRGHYNAVIHLKNVFHVLSISYYGRKLSLTFAG